VNKHAYLDAADNSFTKVDDIGKSDVLARIDSLFDTVLGVIHDAIIPVHGNAVGSVEVKVEELLVVLVQHSIEQLLRDQSIVAEITYYFNNLRVEYRQFIVEASDGELEAFSRTTHIATQPRHFGHVAVFVQQLANDANVYLE
jgi:hypothetical protein